MAEPAIVRDVKAGLFIIVGVLWLGIGSGWAQSVSALNSNVDHTASLFETPAPPDSGINFGIVKLDPSGKQLTIASLPGSPIYNQVGFASPPQVDPMDGTLTIGPMQVANGAKYNVAGITLNGALNTSVDSSDRWTSVADAFKQSWSLGAFKTITIQPIPVVPPLNLDLNMTYARGLSEDTENLSTSVMSSFGILPQLKFGVTTSYYTQKGYSEFDILPGLNSTIYGWDVYLYGTSYSADSYNYKTETVGAGGTLSHKF